MASEVFMKKSEQPDTESLSKKKDLFERKMNEQTQAGQSLRGKPTVIFEPYLRKNHGLWGIRQPFFVAWPKSEIGLPKTRDEYTKMNLTTIGDFDEMYAQNPDHNLTVRGRTTNIDVRFPSNSYTRSI